MTKLQGKAAVYTMFAIVVLTTSLGGLTQTVMNSMLEGIRLDFGVDASISQWLATIYMLIMGITVPITTFLSHKMSVKNMVLLSLGLFFIGSLIDCFAQNFVMLLIGRIPQAVAAGITMPLVTTVSITRFPPNQTGTAMGIAGIALGFAPNIGPLIGGALVDSLGWRSFFVLFMVLVIALAIALVVLLDKETNPARDARLDTPSFLLSTLGFGGLLLGFSNAAIMSIASPFVWAPSVLGIICLVVFVWRQNRTENPLMSPRVFESARFRSSFLAQLFLYSSFMGITLIVPLYIQGLCGGSAFDAGLVFIPATIIALIFNPLSGILSDKLGARRVLRVSTVIMTIGALSMCFMNESTPLWAVMTMQAVRAVGISSSIGPMISWGMSQLPRDIAMDGSACFAAWRQAVSSLFTALMVLAITAVGATAAPAALAYQLAFGISAACALGTAIITFRKVD